MKYNQLELAVYSLLQPAISYFVTRLFQTWLHISQGISQGLQIIDTITLSLSFS